MSTPILDDHQASKQPNESPLQRLRAAVAEEQADLLWFSRPKPFITDRVLTGLVGMGLVLGLVLLTILFMGIWWWIILLLVVAVLSMRKPLRYYRQAKWANRRYDRLYYGLTTDAFWVVSYQSLVRIPLETLTQTQLYQQTQFRFQCTDAELMDQPIMRFHRLRPVEPATYVVPLFPEQAQQLRQALLKLNYPLPMITDSPSAL